MKKVICFGDSNTFGFNPKDGSRYCPQVRWTSVLGSILGEGYEIKEEGCNNRTGFVPNPDGIIQSGQTCLRSCLNKHNNFDIFVLALGTNDLQCLFSIDENVVLNGLKSLTAQVRQVSPDSKIIIIHPVILSEDVLNGYFSFQFNKESISLSMWIQDLFRQFGKNESCVLLDINQHVSPSSIDGLHYSEDSHKIIAKLVANAILVKRE